MFGHVNKLMQEMEEVGYEFKKIDKFDWALYADGVEQQRGRSLGDLIRLEAISLGIW